MLARLALPLVVLAAGCAAEKIRQKDQQGTSEEGLDSDGVDSVGETGIPATETEDSGGELDLVRVVNGVSKFFETTIPGKLQTLLDGRSGEQGLYGVSATPESYGESGTIPGKYEFVWIDSDGVSHSVKLDHADQRSYGWSTRLSNDWGVVSFTSYKDWSGEGGGPQSGEHHGLVVINLNDGSKIEHDFLNRFGATGISGVMEYNGKIFALANNLVPEDTGEGTTSAGDPIANMPSGSSLIILDVPQDSLTSYNKIDLPSGSSNAASLALTQDDEGNDLLVIGAADQWSSEVEGESGQSAFYVDPLNEVLMEDNKTALYQGIGINGQASVSDIGEVLLTGANELGQSLALLDPVEGIVTPFSLPSSVEGAASTDPFNRAYIPDALLVGGTDSIAFAVQQGWTTDTYQYNPYSGDVEILDSIDSLGTISPVSVGDEMFCDASIGLNLETGDYESRVICWGVEYMYE